MPSSIMEVCHWGPRSIGHGTFYISQLDIILLVDRLLHRYGANHIQLHAAAYYFGVRFYILFLNVCPGPYFRWQQLQRCTYWCLRCCWVSARGSLDEAPVVRLSLEEIPPGCGVCGAMTCCCGKGEEDDNEKWKVLKNIL
jgi:hypothetical protein